MRLKYDARVKIDKFDLTPQGFIRIPAKLSKPGVFQYQDAEGNQINEFRPPEEVFAADSLKSSDTLPVTVGHPPSLVDPTNVRLYKVGQVIGTAKEDAGYVTATLQIEDAQTIKQIEDGVLSELSCGYEVELEEQEGSYQGAQYDYVQRDITLNHVSLLGAGQGRQGSDVGLVLDHKGFQYGVEVMAKKADQKVSKKDANEEESKEASNKDAEGSSPDEKDPKAEGEGEKPEEEKTDKFAALVDTIKGMAKAVDDLRAMMAPKKDESSEEEEGEKSEEEKPKDSKTDAKDLDKRLDARLELIEKARKVLPKLDHKGKTDRQIREAVLSHLKVDSKGKSDDYVAAAFDFAVIKQDAADHPLKALLAREDSNDDQPDIQDEVAKRRSERMAGNR